MTAGIVPRGPPLLLFLRREVQPMVRQTGVVAFMALTALGSLAFAAAPEPKEAGGKTSGPLKELAADLGNGIKLGDGPDSRRRVPDGLAREGRDCQPGREAATPGADHQALLPGQVSGDAGAVGSRDGQQPKPFQGAEEPRGKGLLGRLPGLPCQTQRQDRRTIGRRTAGQRTRASSPCPPRPNGNTPAGRGARRAITSATMSRSWAIMPGTA